MYIVLFSGFHGTDSPPALLSHGIEDNAPDANDEADFDIPRYASSVGDIHHSCPICLLAMMNREDLHLCNLVRFYFNGYAYHILCIILYMFSA